MNDKIYKLLLLLKNKTDELSVEIDKLISEYEKDGTEPLVKLPTMVEYQESDDWRFIPLGVALTNTNEIIPLNWQLTYNKDDNRFLSTSCLVCGQVGSGKTNVLNSVINHTSAFADKFQTIVCDTYGQFPNVENKKGVVCHISDIKEIADVINFVVKYMMNRFKFMEKNQTNSIYKLIGMDVDYYRYNGKDLQFDELVSFELPSNEFNSEKKAYVSNTQIATIEELYKRYQDEEFIMDSPIVKIEQRPFVCKNIMVVIDSLSELMNNADYKSVETIKQCLGSIARLGRVAGVNVTLACQRANGATISSDLLANIQLRILVGGCDDSASLILFERNISERTRPDIKGRGFVQCGMSLDEAQFFYNN